MQNFRIVYEEFLVFGSQLVDKVRELIHQGNVRRIIVKDDKGNVFLEIPLSIATVGAVAVPVLAGLGTIAAMLANFTIGVERVQEEDAAAPPESGE